MKKTQQKRRGGKTQKRKDGKTQKRRGEMKRKVMRGGDKTGHSKGSEGSKSYRSSIPVFQAVQNYKIKKTLPFIPERYRANNNIITYTLPGALTPDIRRLNEKEQEMYNEFLVSMTKHKPITNDSIQKWKKFVDEWREKIYENAGSNAHDFLSRTNVNAPH